MNDAERLLRGRHIVDLAGDFEKIDYAIERVHHLLARAFYDLRELAERGRDDNKLAELRSTFDRHYLALRDITSGYLRLEQAHDRLYELMGDDKVRIAEARQIAARKRRAAERLEEDAEEERRRKGYRSTRATPSAMKAPPQAEDMDATVLVGVSSEEVEAAIAAHAGLDEITQPATPVPVPVTAPRMGAIDSAVKQRLAQLRAADDGAADDEGEDWDMPTMQVTAETVAAAMRERGIE